MGDLIVAITDEVSPFVEDPATMYRIVSLIVSDFLAVSSDSINARSIFEGVIADEMIGRVGS